MNYKFILKSRHRPFLLALLMLLAIGTSCKDDSVETDNQSQVYDPSRPVLISDFIPKEGGAYQKMVIYGDNLGTTHHLLMYGLEVEMRLL